MTQSTIERLMELREQFRLKVQSGDFIDNWKYLMESETASTALVMMRDIYNGLPDLAAEFEALRAENENLRSVVIMPGRFTVMAGDIAKKLRDQEEEIEVCNGKIDGLQSDLDTLVDLCRKSSDHGILDFVNRNYPLKEHSTDPASDQPGEALKDKQ